MYSHSFLFIYLNIAFVKILLSSDTLLNVSYNFLLLHINLGYKKLYKINKVSKDENIWIAIINIYAKVYIHH